MIKDEINALKSKDLFELRELYKRYFSRDGVAGNREFYISRIAYRMQEIHYGGLPTGTQFLLENMSFDNTDLHTKIKNGTQIIKEYKNKIHTVTVLHKGFEYENKHYDSLSQVAQTITGYKVSGQHFFRYKKGE